MSETILSTKLLSSSAYSHTIDVPIEKVDIADWLFHVPEAEYRRCCPPDHISCGTTSTDAGQPMSINVEMRPALDSTALCSQFVLTRVETLGEALAAGWRVHARCLGGAVEYTRSTAKCRHQAELNLETLAWTACANG